MHGGVGGGVGNGEMDELLQLLPSPAPTEDSGGGGSGGSAVGFGETRPSSTSNTVFLRRQQTRARTEPKNENHDENKM